MNEHFCVTQFFRDGTYETVRKGVDASAALAAFAHYTCNPASKIGITVRVIITDIDDYINAEWVFGKGLVFPPTGRPT